MLVPCLTVFLLRSALVMFSFPDGLTVGWTVALCKTEASWDERVGLPSNDEQCSLPQQSPGSQTFRAPVCPDPQDSRTGTWGATWKKMGEQETQRTDSKTRGPDQANKFLFFPQRLYIHRSKKGGGGRLLCLWVMHLFPGTGYWLGKQFSRRSEQNGLIGTYSQYL